MKIITNKGWHNLNNPWHFACCDCGLVHTIKFKNDKVLVKRNNKYTKYLRNLIKHDYR